jgi:hypothetical protein
LATLVELAGATPATEPLRQAAQTAKIASPNAIPLCAMSHFTEE